MQDHQATAHNDVAQLECKNVWKAFGSEEKALARALATSGEPPKNMFAAVRGVSFQVKPAETLVIMGLSGSGKSTLIRCITRLVEPTAGEVLFNGQSITEMNGGQLREFHRSQCAMVFQHFGLLPNRRVLDNVAFGLEVRGVSRREREQRAMEALDLVGLANRERHYPSELSGGMKQRVGLARALVVDPGLLLFDEPFSALDPLIRRDLQDELLRLRTNMSKTMLFITHDMSEALKLGDRIAIMRDGEFVQVGTPEEIVLQPADDYVRRFVSDTPRTNVIRAGSIATAQQPLTVSESPSHALSQMGRASSNGAVVVDRDGKPLGAVSLDTVRSAIARGASDLMQVVTPIHVVRQDDDLVGVGRLLAAEGEGSSVVVVDAQARFVGTVDATAVLEALVGVVSSRPPTDDNESEQSHSGIRVTSGSQLASA